MLMTIDWGAVEACGTIATAALALLALVRANQALRVARDSFVISSAITRGAAGAALVAEDKDRIARAVRSGVGGY